MAFAKSDVRDASGAAHGTLTSYSVGFILSVILTAASFAAVMVPGLVPHDAIVPVIMALAVVQMFVHLYFFLHLNFSSDQRWNVTAFAFAALTVLVVVIGSLWIMYNINSNMVLQSRGAPHAMQEM